MANESLTQSGPGGGSEFVLYTSADGRALVQVRLADGAVWLTQRQMAELFQKTVPTINHHIGNVYAEGELTPKATIRNLLIVQTEGTRQVERQVDYYSLDMILAVGYRVRSQRGTQFRQWATSLLSEYVVKGFVMDDQRLKDVRNLGPDYFDELLERIRDIRASERRFYQKITDIYATSVDYDRRDHSTRDFFATVQNKLHWAIHGHTAAELVHARADAAKPHMGLTTWTNGPHGPVRRADIDVAKNYLTHEELSELNRIVTMYLDYAETRARQRKAMAMADWAARLDAFLQFNEQNVLTHAGAISHELAEAKAAAEFEAYEAQRRLLEAQTPSSDFDRAVEEVRRLDGKPGNR